jgi:ferric-dicitrate binding protein FerR (iron transport regulator)
MILAPATTVRLTTRGLEVTGEAYFTVARHQTHPFVVRTSNATARVLGTRFSVRHYRDETRSRVVVEQGRVALQLVPSRGADVAHTVVSERMLAFVTDSGITISSGIATRDYTGWTDDTLVFKQAALGDVVAELARVYGTTIQVRDTLLAQRVLHMDVSIADEPLSRVLDEICKLTEAHYTREGGVVVISSGRVRLPLPVQPRHLFPQPEQQYGR